MLKTFSLIIIIFFIISCRASIYYDDGMIKTQDEINNEELEKYGIDISLDDNIILSKIEENLKSYFQEKGSYKVIFKGVSKESYNNNTSSISFLTYEAAKKIGALHVIVDVSNIEFRNNAIKSEMFADGNIPNETVALSFIFPKNKITTIETLAFSDLVALKEIILPNSVITIEKEAFQYCRQLSKLILGNNVKTIGNYAFVYAESLEELIIPNSVISIGEGAFGNSGLKKLTLSSSIKNLGNRAFASSLELNTIIYYGTSPNAINNNDALSSCPKLTTLIVPNAENVNDPTWKTFLGANFTDIRKQ